MFELVDIFCLSSVKEGDDSLSTIVFTNLQCFSVNSSGERNLRTSLYTQSSSLNTKTKLDSL